MFIKNPVLFHGRTDAVDDGAMQHRQKSKHTVLHRETVSRHPAAWERFLWPGAVFVLLTGLYVITMPGHTTLEDSGILITVAQFAGLAHPPGYPLYTMLGTLFTLLPFGTIAVRVQLLSAVAGALACVCVYFCCLLLSKRRVAAFFAALFYGVSGLLWRQSLVAEVYTLHALFLFLLLYLALRLHQEFTRRDLYLFTLTFALGLSHHWPLLLLNGILFVPLFLATALKHRPRPSAYLAMAPKLAILVLLGLLPYLYLVIRSFFDPSITTFGPVALADLPDYILRQRYADVDVSHTASLTDSLLFVLHFLRECLQEMGVVSTLAVCAGMAWAGLYEKRSIALALVAGFLTNSLLLLVFLKFDYDVLTRDTYMFYQAVPFGVCAIFLHYCLTAAPRALPDRLRRVFPACLGVVFCVTTFVANVDKNDMHDNTFAFDYASAVLEALPKGAAVFLFADHGPVAYTYYAGQVRPDVRLYSQVGYLFKNRLVGAQQAVKASTLLRFLDAEDDKRFFLTFSTQPFLALVERDVHLHDHGYLYELSRSETKIALDVPPDAARAFLDRHWSDNYGNFWTYYRQRFVGQFCHTLMLRGEEHPAFERHYYCKILFARYLKAQGENERAAGLFREVLASRTPWRKNELVQVYFDYGVTALDVINRKPAEDGSREAAYQRLVDEIYPATTIWPVCDNLVTHGLLNISSQISVDVHLDELTKTFGRCDNLASLFKKARRTRL